MLAAAGGPGVHPHATSGAAERGVWERDVAQVGQDMRRLEEFFLAVANGGLRGEQQDRAGMSFIATDTVPQGPFYTVGYVLASTVEAELGRDRLVRTSCDPVTFLRDYNEAAARRNRGAGERLPLWSERLLRRFQEPASSRSTR
jgi:hypothetical protein